MIVLFPIETASRELPYKSYLSHLLAKNGFTCYLGSKANINFLMNRLKGYIYFDKGYQRNKSERLYDLVRKQNGLIVNLDEEGAIDYSDNRTLLRRYSEVLFDSVDKIFLWGEKQRDLLADKIVSNNVVISGHPRFELLKHEFHYLYQPDVDSLKKKYGSFILINTNMGFGNNIRGDDFVLSGYGKWFDNINDIVRFDKKKMEAYISLIKILFKSYKGTIILRPHPEEDGDFYRRVLSNRKNLIITNTGSVVPWILASEAMVHPDCTTAIESIILGKKPISYLPECDNQSLITDLPTRVSYNLDNLNNISCVLKKLNSIVGGIDAKDHQILDDYFSITNNTSDHIVNEIKEMARRHENNSSDGLSKLELLYLQYRSLRQKFKYFKGVELINQKMKGLSTRTTLQLHNTLIKNNASLRTVRLRKITHNLFYYF